MKQQCLSAAVLAPPRPLLCCLPQNTHAPTPLNAHESTPSAPSSSCFSPSPPPPPNQARQGTPPHDSSPSVPSSSYSSRSASRSGSSGNAASRCAAAATAAAAAAADGPGVSCAPPAGACAAAAKLPERGARLTCVLVDGSSGLSDDVPCAGAWYYHTTMRACTSCLRPVQDEGSRGTQADLALAFTLHLLCDGTGQGRRLQMRLVLNCRGTFTRGQGAVRQPAKELCAPAAWCRCRGAGASSAGRPPSRVG